MIVTVYADTTSVDKSAARAKALGAKVHVEPLDVMDTGRMSVIQDPVGAMFCIWQPNKNKGVGLRGEHGTGGAPRVPGMPSAAFG
jgi:hypothetical protein